jgi:hypothetical protein
MHVKSVAFPKKRVVRVREFEKEAFIALSLLLKEKSF